MPGSLELIERLDMIERRLQQRPWTTGQLARELEVDPKTVLRAIEYLQTRGVVIEHDAWRRGRRYWIPAAQALNQVRVTTHEAGVLYLATRLLGRMTSSHNPLVSEAVRKLARPLEQTAPAVAAQMIRVAAILEAQAVDRAAVEIMRTMLTGWIERRAVTMHYHSQRGASERVVQPYILEPLEMEQAIYVIGHDSQSTQIRVFKLERIQAATLQRNTFTIPEDFDLATHLRPAWGIMVRQDGHAPEQVVLEFEPAVAREIQERRWHPTQEITMLTDGRCRFTVTVDAADEMMRWIRRWGLDQVTVRAPTALRDRLRQEVIATLARYEEQHDH